MNNNNSTYITPEDFASVGVVAQHCDLQKLSVATSEALTFDIIPLFCFDFVQDVLENWEVAATIPNPDFIDAETTPDISLTITNPNYEKYKSLIDGGNYSVEQRLHQNLGFKKVWIYYSYARYLLINQLNDTANGTVQKQNEWSVPTPLKEITTFSNKYRDMGREAYNSVQGYLCASKSDFPTFDDCNCNLNCGCSGTCTCGRTKKMSGLKFKTVSK